MIRSQPVAVAGGLSALIAPLVSWALPSAPLPVQGVLVILLVGAIVTVARRFSFPIETLLNAGFNPALVASRAADPRVPRFVPLGNPGADELQRLENRLKG